MYIISVGFMYIWKLNSYLEGWLKICLKKKGKQQHCLVLFILKPNLIYSDDRISVCDNSDAFGSGLLANTRLIL